MHKIGTKVKCYGWFMDKDGNVDGLNGQVGIVIKGTHENADSEDKTWVKVDKTFYFGHDKQFRAIKQKPYSTIYIPTVQVDMLEEISDVTTAEVSLGREADEDYLEYRLVKRHK